MQLDLVRDQLTANSDEVVVDAQTAAFLVEIHEALMAYIAEAKAAAGPWYYTGRPLADVIRDMREHIERIEGVSDLELDECREFVA